MTILARKKGGSEAEFCFACQLASSTRMRFPGREPLREVVGFKTDMFDPPALVPDGLCKGFRLVWGSRVHDDASAFVDDVDVHLTERDIETYKKVNGLNFLSVATQERVQTSMPDAKPDLRIHTVAGML